MNKDPCDKFDGVVFSGGYALIFAGESKELIGKAVLAVEKDKYGWWECYDRAGDLVIIEEKDLMPISDIDLDDGTELEKFIYEARYGI